MPDMIAQAAQSIRASFDRAEDILAGPLSDRDRLHKAGPHHRRRKHAWDFQTLGAAYFVRHARRQANVGEWGPAVALGALAVPTGLASLCGIGLLPRVAAATLKWPWYFGYVNPQGDESLRKDLVQFQLQEAVAELQVVATYAEHNPAQKHAMRHLWSEARRRAEAFETHLQTYEPKTGGSRRLRKRLHNFKYLLDAHA